MLLYVLHSTEFSYPAHMLGRADTTMPIFQIMKLGSKISKVTEIIDDLMEKNTFYLGKSMPLMLLYF